MEKEKRIVLELSGGVVYRKEISEALAGQIILLCGRYGGDDVISSVAQKNLGQSTTKESVAEYVIRVGANRNTDKILAFAAYITEQQQKQSVSPEEIKLLFRDAGEALPANFSRDFKDTTSSGWLAPEPQKKGYYYVTKTGSDVIARKFEQVQVKRPKINSVRKNG